MQKEYLYILSNPEHEGLLKIGKTKRQTPDDRAKQLSSSTGVLGIFSVEWYIVIPDCDIAEKMVHNKLDRYKVQQNREFFKVSLLEVIDIALRILKPYFYEIHSFEIYESIPCKARIRERELAKLEKELDIKYRNK